MSKLELSQNVKEFLDWLNSIERELEEKIIEDSRNLLTGEKIIKKLFPEERSIFKGQPINVIPQIGTLGPCASILFVAIGKRDRIKERILEAIEHVSVKCKDTTKYVIFYAALWDTIIWLKHMGSFKKLNIITILKIPLQDYFILK